MDTKSLLDSLGLVAHPAKSIFIPSQMLSLGQTLSTFHYTLLDKCRTLLSVVERGWPNALDFSLDLKLNIPLMYYLMINSLTECLVYYLMNSNCTCVRSTTLDNFALDQTSLDKKQTSLNKVAKRSRHFTQHTCRALYSEKSRAFGQGFSISCMCYKLCEYDQGCQVAWDQRCQIPLEKLPKVAKQIFSHNDVTKFSRMRT